MAKRDVASEKVNIKKGFFLNDSSMTRSYSETEKNAVLKYFATKGKVGMVGTSSLRDPVTGERYSHENKIYESDKYIWSDALVYMFKKYSILLTDEFINDALSLA